MFKNQFIFFTVLTIKYHPKSEYWLKYFLYIKVYSINILIFIIKSINNELKNLKKFEKILKTINNFYLLILVKVLVIIIKKIKIYIFIDINAE